MTDVYGSLGCLAVCLFTGNDADGGGGGGGVGDGGGSSEDNSAAVVTNG